MMVDVSGEPLERAPFKYDKAARCSLPNAEPEIAQNQEDQETQCLIIKIEQPAT